MSTYVEGLIDQVICVITTQGRVFTGILKSLDQLMNIVLIESYEKVFSKEEGVKFIKMGLYMIRGDNVSIISEVDELLEKQIDYSSIKADPLKNIKI